MNAQPDESAGRAQQMGGKRKSGGGTSALRGIKAAVIAMGVVIVIGFVVVVVTIVGRLSESDEVTDFGRVVVPMPSGCELVHAWSESGLLYLRYEGVAACQQVVLVAPESGEVIGRVSAHPGPQDAPQQ